MSADELLGSLIAHEMSKVKGDEIERKGKKGIALKASYSSSKESSDVNEIALFKKKLRSF